MVFMHARRITKFHMRQEGTRRATSSGLRDEANRESSSVANRSPQVDVMRVGLYELCFVRGRMPCEIYTASSSSSIPAPSRTIHSTNSASLSATAQCIGSVDQRLANSLLIPATGTAFNHAS